jgi:hypothetical protein
MVDITLPRPAVGPRITPHDLLLVWALLVAFLIALNWSAVLTQTAQRSCDTTTGGFSNGFSSGYETLRCRCQPPSLDFTDPCNSIYIPIL